MLIWCYLNFLLLFYLSSSNCMLAFKNFIVTLQFVLFFLSKLVLIILVEIFFIWINYFNLNFFFNFIYLQFFLSLKFNPNSFDCYFFLIKMIFNFFFYNSILFNFFLLGLILIILIVIFFTSIRFFNWLFLFISSFNVNLIVFF
jgi:hypothetical protein